MTWIHWIILIWRGFISFLTAGAELKHVKAKVNELTVDVADCHDKHEKCQEHHRKCEEEMTLVRAQLDTLDAKLFVATVIVCDEGRITKMSIGATKLFFWKEEHARGREVAELIAYFDRAEFCKVFEEAARHRILGRVKEMQLQAQNRTGTTVPMQVLISGFESENEWYAAIEFKEQLTLNPILSEGSP